MQSVLKGMLAGFVATAIMSALMMIKSMMGLMPELDVIAMLSRMMGSNAQTAWMAHFAIGPIHDHGLVAENAEFLAPFVADPSEECGKAVVIALAKRLIRVVVALGALQPNAEK